LAAAARVKAANPAARWCCDPVLGDVGRGVFVRPGVPEFMREQAVPAADIVTPNQFELEYLSGLATDTLAGVKGAVAAVHRLGPKVVLVTSIKTREMPPDTLDMIAGEGGRFWRVRTPKLSLSVNGAGDAIAALFFVHYARSQSAEIALIEASASIFGLLKRTADAGSREILTVAAQDEFVSPTHRFPAEEV
ncbi:MAG: pyridoxal kinase, partial [Microvirga sp.]